MSFNPFAAGGIKIEDLPYFMLRKIDGIGSDHGFELVKIEPLENNRETSMGRLELEDLFVKSGEIVKGTEVPEKYNPSPDRTYMHLILSNDEGTEVYIDVTDLVDMPDADKVPLDNDNSLTVDQLNQIKNVFGENISYNTTVLDIILSIANIIENAEIWAEEVRVKNITNGGDYDFQYVFKPDKSTDHVQLALENIDKEFKTVHDNLTTIGQQIINIDKKIDIKVEEINDKLTIVDNSISSINNSITTITGDITTIKSNVSSMSETIINHTSAISTINEQITNINKTISDNYTDLSKKITAIENSLNIFQEDVNYKLTTINKTISDNYTDLSERITTVENNLNTFQEDVNYKLTNINHSVTAITNDLNGIKADIKVINNKIETIQSNLTDLTARVAQNETDISDIKEQLKKLVLTGKTTLYGTIDITNQEVGIKNAVGRAYTAGRSGEVFNDYETNVASGQYSTTHGYGNSATGNYSFAANNTNTVKANAATVTGFNNTVTQRAVQSLTSGANNLNDAKRGMVTGQFNKIINDNEIAGGKYNSSTEELPLARSYGNGTSDENRSNLEYLTVSGNHYIEGSYLMHPLPENFDLDNLGAPSETYSTDMNKWYYTTGGTAKTIKNIPEVITSDLLTNPQTGFVLKVMNYYRQSIFYPDGYATSVQVLYCGGAIFSRGYLIESYLGWSPWEYIGGISASNDALISLADDQPSYLNITSQGGETTFSVHYNSNLTFYYNFFISVNTEVKTVQVNIKDESQSLRTFFSTAGIGYSGDDKFEYRLKDKNTLIMTSESGFKVGTRYNVKLYGTFNPVK